MGHSDTGTTNPEKDKQKTKAPEHSSGCDAMRRALIVVIAGLLFSWASPYLVAEESVKRTFGSLFGGLIGMDYPKSGEQPIAVVTVDDDDLQQMGAVWPLPYQYHADVLKRLALLGSKRIMVDILFLDARKDPTLPAFKDTLCALKKQGIEIFMASQVLDDGRVYLRPELAAIAAPIASPDKACITAVTVGATLDGYDQRAWTYAHTNEEPHQDLPESAAFAIYKSISPAKAEHLPEADMALLWGTQGSAFNQKWMRKAGATRSESVAHCKAWSKSDLLPAFARWDSLFNPAAADMRPVCPYHMTIPVRALQDYKGANPFGSFGDSLRDVTVFYGASLIGTQDVIESPVHGPIPGVHLHAMALDNLLNFGDHYLLAEEFSLMNPSNPATQMTLVCLVAVALFSLFLELLLEPRFEQAAPGSTAGSKSECISFFLRCVKNVLKSAFALSLCYLLYRVGRFCFHLGPLSWIEFIVLPMVLELLEKIEKIDKRVVHLWKWIKGNRRQANAPR